MHNFLTQHWTTIVLYNTVTAMRSQMMPCHGGLDRYLKLITPELQTWYILLIELIENWQAGYSVQYCYSGIVVIILLYYDRKKLADYQEIYCY